MIAKLFLDSRSSGMVEVCIEFVLAIHHHSLTMLDSIITMDKTMICYHTSKKKEQSQQWIKKGQQSPMKAKVHANRTKEMLLAFFYNKGLIYLHIVPRGSTVNAAYIIKDWLTGPASRSSATHPILQSSCQQTSSCFGG
jgi:hypothetical protein